MLRRPFATVALLLVPATFAVGPGCSDEPFHEDLCAWLGTSTNCCARFASDVGSMCAQAHVEGSDPVANASGYFQTRDALDICILNAGGQVIFDPPLDLTAFPPTELAFTILDDRAHECGSGSYAGEQTFAITVNSVDMLDAGAATAPDGGPLGDNIVGGTFSTTAVAGRDVFDISCPGGLENHHFNRLFLEKCEHLASFVPRAYLDTSPGIPPSNTRAATDGYVRLRVYYPPEDPEATDAAPRAIEYFNCSIPAPPHRCQDGVKNGDETDIDCGGSCPTKCVAGQSCVQDSDCSSGNCTLNGGLKQCA